jgi:hypothetical protein
MTENEILAEVKKGIDLFLDKTYEVSDLYSHMMAAHRPKSIKSSWSG